ncbi:hypothetical protein GGI12_003376 [Dipsacomyces acuminosporus]|nr:hypothetical protein GGI12_003376 [Dipsacomyces acuminosporus]
MKNGKIYMRDDHLVVLDLASSTTLVAMDEYTQNVYEYKRPLHLDSLAPESAHRTYPWDLNQMPERVAKAVRVGCRCILYLLSQQKRIKISTPQGKGWLFEDSPLGTFKFAFFNGIKVDVSRRNAEATVEIPSSQDLPNEIQKIPLLPSDFPHALGTNGDDEDNIGSGDIPLDFSDLSMQRRHHQHSGSSENGRKIPEKIRGILEHAKEALRKVLEFDTVLMEFEEGGSLCQQYEGSIGYPVSLSWDWDGSSDLDYVPPGLARRRQPPPKPTGGSSRNDKDFGALPMSVSNTAGSTTAVASVRSNSRRLQELEDRQKHQHHHQHHHHHQRQQQNIRAADDQRDHQKQKWNVNALDRRTVDDTPTRRLNMGPITRLVEEFNQPVNLQDHIVADRRYQAQQAQQAQLQKFLSTPGSLFRTPAAGHSNRGFSSTQVHLAAQQGFEDACFIPDVGWCLLASTSDDDEDCLFTILFCDGCRVLVKQKMQAIWYKDGAVEYADLPIDHSLPVRVKERIKWLPQFLSAMGFEI